MNDTIPMLAVVPYRNIADWLACLDASYLHLKATGWTFINTLRAGIDQFGRTDHAKADLYALAGNQLGVSPRTLANYVSLSRSAVAEIAQGLDLDFAHAHAALGLEPDVARDILSTAAERGWEPAQVRREAWVRKQTSHNIVKSNSAGDDATEIDDEVPFNHVPNPNGTSPVDLYEQQPETLTIPRPVTRGRIECRSPHDPQAHVELVVDGRTLYLEYQGSFIQFELPKQYGIYRR